MSDDDGSLSGLLSTMSGQGIYSIALVEQELPQYGFRYVRENDALWFGLASTTLGAKSPVDAEAEEGDTAIDSKKATDLVFDAIDLTQAILRLIAPDQPQAGESYNRPKQYERDVALITTLWRS